MRKISRFAVALSAVALAGAIVPAANAADADRLAGSDRYETAIAVSNQFGTADTVYLARGDNQADAVTGGKLAGGPLLLVSDAADVRAKVADQVKKLAAKKVVVLGGTSAVSEETVKAVAGTLPVTRLSGATRYDTAVAISKQLNPQTSAKVYLANGRSLVDALVGGSITDNAPILLTDGSGTLPASTLEEIKRLKPSEVIALGGTKAVLPSELSAAASANGAGGGLNETEAKAKATADLVKALREAKFKSEGYLTVASGKTVDQFLASSAKSGTAVKAELETTWPKVLVSDVTLTDAADGWFAVDGDTDTKSAKDADALRSFQETLNGKAVLGFRGLTAANDNTVGAAANAAAISTRKSDLTNALTQAVSAGSQETKKIGSTLAGKITSELGDAVLYTANGAPLNANTTLKELAAALGIQDATFAVPGSTGTAAEQKKYTDALDKLVDNQSTRKSAIAAKAAVAADATNQLTAKGTTPTQDQIQAYMGAGGAKASRISGATRFLTALEIAKTAYPSGSGAKGVYVANGYASADATVAGFIDNKAELRGPVLLSEQSAVPTEVVDYLKAAHGANSALTGSTFKALGGLAVISDSVIADVKKALS